MCCGLLSESIQDVLRMDEVRRSHLVVIKLILKKGRTNVHIEIREYNGGIKITGLLYLLGLGLGTFFIYKYCSRISPYIYHSFFSSPAFLSPLFSNHQASSSVDVTNLQSPDSGVCSDQKGGGVANNPPLNESTVKVLDWFKKGDFSKDEDDEDMKKMMMSGFSSGYMSGTTENVDLSSSKGLKKDDAGVRRPSVSHVFRRNCRSYASLKSNDSSLYNYRESLLSKGFSVDLGETLDDVISPYNHALQLDFRGLQGDVVVGCDGGEGGLEEELQGVLDQLKTDLHSMTLQLSRLNKVDNDGDDDDVFDGGDFIDDYSFFPLDDHHHMNHEINNNNNNHANNNNNNHVNHNNANNNHGDNDVNKDGDHANRSNGNINHVNNNKAFSKHCNKDIKSRNKIIFKYRIEEEEGEEEDDDAGKLPSCEVPAGFGAYESCNNNNNNKRNNSNNNNDEEEEEEEYMWDYRSDLVTSSKRFVSLRPCHNNNNNNNNDTNNNNNNNNNSNNKLRSEENNDKEFVKSPQNDFEVDSLKGEDSRPDDDDDEDEDDLVDNKRLKLFSNEMTQLTNGGLHDFSDDDDDDDEGDDVVMFFLDDGIDTCWRNGGGRSKGRSKLAVKGRSLRREPIRSLGGQVVGPVKGLHEHLETDLKIDLLISSHIRKAYSCISSKFNITNVRCISSVMHASFLPLTYLSIIHPSPSIIKITSNFQTAVQNLIISIDTQHEYLKEWSISGRHNILFKLISSLKTFSQQTSIVSSIAEESHKHNYLSTLLNQHNYIEESLVHGFKVALILINIQLQKCNPRDFFNSINNVNGPFTPEQLQMISDVSSCDITIIRPSMFLHPSFISSYSPSSSLALPSSSSPHPQQSSLSSHPQSQPSLPSSSSSHPPPPPSSSHPPPSSPLSPNEAPSQPPTPVFTIIEEEMGAMHCVPSN